MEEKEYKAGIGDKVRVVANTNTCDPHNFEIGTIGKVIYYEGAYERVVVFNEELNYSQALEEDEYELVK